MQELPNCLKEASAQLKELCDCEACVKYHQKMNKKTEIRKKFQLPRITQLNSDKIQKRKSVINLHNFIRNKFNVYTDYIDFLHLLSQGYQKSEQISLGFAIPETVVFNHGGLYCVYNQDQKGIIKRNINKILQDVKKIIKKLHFQIQYILKWCDGKISFMLGSIELLCNNEILNLILNYKGEINPIVQNIQYFFRAFKSKCYLYQFKNQNKIDKKLEERAQIIINIQNNQISEENQQYINLQQELDFIQNLYEKNHTQCFDYLIYKTYLFCIEFCKIELIQFDCDFEVDHRNKIFITNVCNIKKKSSHISHLGKKSDLNFIKQSLEMNQQSYLDHKKNLQNDYHLTIKKLISDILYHKYDQNRSKFIITHKIESPLDCFSQQLFHQCYPQVFVKIDDLLTYDIATIKNLVKTDFQPLYRVQIVNNPNIKDQKTIIYNKKHIDRNSMNNPCNFDVQKSFRSRLFRIDKEIQFSQVQTRKQKSVDLGKIDSFCYKKNQESYINASRSTNTEI